MRLGMEHEKLPPLVEAVPEIRDTRAGPDRQLQYSRIPYDSIGCSSRLSGPSLFTENRTAPTPLSINRTRNLPPSLPSPSSHQGQVLPRLERPAYPSTNGHNSAPSVYSDYSQRVSYDSNGSLISPSRHDSPIHLPTPRPYTIASGSASGERPHYSQTGSAPLLYSNGSENRSYMHSNGPQVTPQQTSHDYYAGDSRPLIHPSYNGSHHQDYSYSNGQSYDRSPFSAGSRGSYPSSIDGYSEHGDSKQKRRRGNLPKAVTDTLRVWFTEHIAHPYPTEEEKQNLMSQTGLTISQISNWFINARRRSLPQMTKQAQTEAGIRDTVSITTSRVRT